MKSSLGKILFALFIFLFIAAGVVSFFSSKSVFAETAIIISPTESQVISGAFEANIDWTTEGASATCAYVYDDFGPTIFSSTGWTEVDCGLAGSDIPAPNTDGEHTLRVAAWLGAGFTSNATSDYVTFTYTSDSGFTGEGAGTELDPYVITTCTQLQEMNDFLDADFVLGNDIDCAASATWNENVDEWVDGIVDGTLIDDEYVGVVNNGYYGFEPIGQYDAANNSGQGFTGTLDGQQNTISNLWIFRKGNDFNGLIGYATNATIKNFTLDNPRVVGAAYTGSFVGRGIGVNLLNLENNQGMVRAYLEYYGGGIAGYLENSSTATGLFVIDGTVHGSGNIIGGLVGLLNNSSVSESTSSADVDGGEYIGGAFGLIQNYSVVNDVDASGDVVSNDGDDIPSGYNFSKNGYWTGGFAGGISNSIVEDSTASGLVTAEDEYAGGFAGDISEQSSISNSSATGNVSGEEYVGGFAGRIDNSNIEDSSASGNASALGSYVGGFSGASLCGSSFLRVSASGDVDSGNSYVGGFTGFDACEGPGSTFTQVAAHGDVLGNNLVGGFVGESNQTTFTNVYAGGSVSANDQVGSFGGVVTSGTLDNVYARGLIIMRDAGTFVGGFINDATNSTITDSFWDGESVGQEIACQTGACAGLTELTTIQAKTQSMYTDASWDFENIWGMNSDNDGYPHFFWESFGPLVGSGTLEDPYQMTQCFDATESGYYELQNNIIDVTGNCITIEANDVFIDGDNHTISGSDGDYAIFSEGYDSISISNITLETFIDGIRLLNAQGTSIITDVTILDMDDDGIELRGVSGMTISDSTITGMNDDGIAVRSYYDNANDTSVYNIDLVIQNLVISDTEDFGMDLEYVTGLLITENEIFDTEDDGINAYVIEDAQILNNSIHDVGSDGIYAEQIAGVLISENTIDNTMGSDGIDIDYDDYSSNVTVTNNTLTNTGDVGIEIGGLYGGTITGNTIVSNDEGISVYGSEDLEFSENTITPTTNEFFEIPSVTTESIALDILDADQSSTNDYNSFTYTLPFTFDFQGRDITEIEVNVNGSVELLEDGESCIICGSGDSYENNLINDVLFASFDGLTAASAEGDYVAVFSPDDEYVVVEWKGSTQYDYDSATYPIHFQLVIYPDGEVQWNFMEMNFQLYYYDMFTGAYDLETGDLYRAGLAINEPSSYSADFSGDTNYELTEAYDPITGIDLYEVSSSSFIGNTIHADRWVYTEEVEDVVFNDSDSGNTYRLLNGDGAWTIFDIVDTDGNGFAESGDDRPFNQTTLGTEYWSGEGEDAYPGAIAASVVAPTVRRSRSGSSRRSPTEIQKIFKESKDLKDGDNDNEDQESQNSTSNNTSVSTTRELQRFLNTNGFPIAQTGPGSLNNETDTFGELTRQALAKFQQANGISPALGIFGPITKAFINKNATTPSTTPPSDTSRNLELNSTGPDVSKLQELLIKAGYPITAGVTGYFGQQTKDALIAYQKANNILPATGYFGPLTKASMKGKGLGGL